MLHCVIGFFILVLPISATSFQNGSDGEIPKCVVAPADQALVAVASQPDSPLVFENVKALACYGRHGITSYQLRNRGTKPIKSFTIAGWSSEATGFKWGWGASTPEEMLMPGQLAPIKEKPIEIVPLTVETRRELNLNGSLEGVMILMVVKVEFTDGTSYTAESASKALENYFEK
jgi:hypothetical protein